MSLASVVFDDIISIDPNQNPGYESTGEPIDPVANTYLVVMIGSPGRNYLVGGTLSIQGNLSNVLYTVNTVMVAGVPQMFPRWGVDDLVSGYSFAINAEAGQVVPYDTRLYVAGYTPS